jgi:hypothetical protein
MELLKRIALSGLAATLLIGVMQIAVSGQIRRGVRVVSTTSQPVVVRRVYYRGYYDPFWRGTLWDPYYSYDPYFYDPYLRAQRDKYYREKAVRDAKRNLAKHREKYGYDGYLTDKERKKLAKDQRKYNKGCS